MQPHPAHFQLAVRFFQLCTTELWVGLEPRSLPTMPDAMKPTRALAVLRSLGSLTQLLSREVRKLPVVIGWLASH
jgi:hypothetical protein